MPSNLIKKDNTYYVRVAVPRPLWKTVGRREVWRTTGTGDLAKAERAKHGIIATIKDEIDSQSGPANDPASPAWLTKQVQSIREAIRKGSLDPNTAQDFIEVVQDKHLAAIGEVRGGDLADPETASANVASEATARRLRGAARIATDLQFRPLSEVVDDYLSEKEGKIEASTLHVKRRELIAFREWLDDDPDVSEVTRRIAGRYVSEVIGRSERSASTKISVVSALSAFWNYCIRKGLSEQANPWSGLAEDLKDSKRGRNGSPRRPWKPEEFAKIETIPTDDPMHPLCKIAMYSGMRLNEIAHLETTDVFLEKRMVCLPEGKTESSVRQVPIHSAILPLFERLYKEAEKAERTYLIPGLKPGGLDNKRGTAVGKRIGRWIRREVSKDKGVVFHSLRNTFMHACENAGIMESTTQLIVGHARQSLTYGLYSPGVHFELLAEAVERVSYDPAR